MNDVTPAVIAVVLVLGVVCFVAYFMNAISAEGH
jgi:hypothetical protein